MDKNFEDMGLLEMAKTLGDMGDELRKEKPKSVHELAALICEYQGMFSENMQRYHLNQSMAYTDEQFFKISTDIRKLAASPQGE